ncbi:uncharacterized protein LOC127720503 [Mytilus californianus]|uniref:uncharacterized protein LOC127720503 n=1 Tax=Mytilus californianus TaxID=6549 RepID=UPI002247A3BD|nr:uncharacterized protein LOC127720503 [Mytilus californianus]
MADTITPTISLALYRYLCQHIVGTEDHVKRIRMMNAVKDRMDSTKNITFITSGSFGEGLQMRGSDLDVMYLDTRFEVFEDVKPRFNPNKIYFSMERDDVKPGYTQLRLEYITSQHNGENYYSSALYKQHFIFDEGLTIHGPCITDEYEQTDTAFCFHCKTWVSTAVQWITRSSNAWPSHNVKENVIKHGVILVPIGVKGSPKEDLEWRVSFSVGEKLLINTFTHTQLLCYVLLKIILKDVIATYSDCKDLLCSYFMKTIIFWISEELPQYVWKPDNFIPCFMRCFSRLVYCVEHSVCLHYFIPENNMFENKIEGRGRKILLEKLYMLYSYGWRCILFSDQISNFHGSRWTFHIETHKLYVNDVEKILDSNFLFLANFAFKTRTVNLESILKNGILQIMMCPQSSIKDLYKHYMSMCFSARAQIIPLESTFSNNKYRYKQYKSCLSTLLLNVYHDAVSGWLMVASLFYKTKQYRKALHIIGYSISKCTPEKLHHHMTMADIHYKWLKLQSFQRKSLVYLQKNMLVDFVSFVMNSTIIPDELGMEESMFPSTAYAYFLNCLCHYHINNVRQCQDSLQYLQLTIEEKHLMPQILLRAEAYNLLGIALQLLGDTDSARQAFLQSAELC